MKIVVTGGAGYIGSVITEQLVTENNQVIVLDDLSKGHREAVAKHAEFIDLNLSESDKLREVFRTKKPDAVIHMAASSLVGESVADPRKYYANNVGGGLSLLDAMNECGVRRLVFSSSAAVYGEPAKQPIEEGDPTAPTNPYGETKLAFERALQWYSRAYGLQYTSLRYFNAAGASERFGEMHDPETHLIPAILQAASGKRKDVEIFGDDYPTRDGTCVRDYVHVIDLARAHILALNSEGNRIFNLGCGGNGYTVREMLNIAQEVTGKTVPSRVVQRRPGDPAVLIASSDRIKRELIWTPRFQDPRAIIESAWKWMQKFPDGYSE
jgi:UDP-glucose 4-epimerase